MVHRFVLQRVVEFAALHVFGKPIGQRSYPFPVAIVAQVHGTRTAIVQHFVEFLHTRELHSLAQCTGRHRHQFDGFYDIVAEPMVEAFFNGAQFRFCFIGKALFQVLPNNLMAIFHHL